MAWLENFRDNLRSALNAKGMTQQQLAQESGLHFVTVSRILGGIISPSVETCERLASAVGIDSPKIFSEKR